MTTYLAGQAPDYVNPADVRVNADIGISAWDGTDGALADGAPREIATVMPLVRDYIIAQKQVAAAQVSDEPTLKALATTWPELEAASKPVRERRAAERETERWEPTPANVVLA